MSARFQAPKPGDFFADWSLFDGRLLTPDYLATVHRERPQGTTSDSNHPRTMIELTEQDQREPPLVLGLPKSSTEVRVESLLNTSTRSSSSGQMKKDVAPPQRTIPSGHSQPAFSRLHGLAFIATVCMAQFLSLAALAQSVAPLLIIGQWFHIQDPGPLSWYTAAYSLTVGTFILPAGRLGDMYGHKKMFLIGWTWFAVWSLVAGCAVWSGSILFSVARGFQGIGPAILVPNSMALIGRAYPVGMKRNMIFSCFGAGGPTGFVAGAALSALLAQKVWWPWAFWALAIVNAVMLCLSVIVIPADTARNIFTASVTSVPKFDYKGALTGVSGLILINFAWNQGPVVGWTTPYVYVLFLLGILSMVAFFYVELRLTTHPLIPLRGLTKDAGFALACIAAGWASHGIWIYYMFWFLGLLRGNTSLSQAAQTSPVAPVGAIFAFGSGLLMLKIRPAYVMLLAMSCFLTGSILIATAPVDQSYWCQTFLSILIMPGGMNLSFPAATILLSNALPREHQGIAASLVSVTVNYSISIGLGFAGTIDRHVTDSLDGKMDYLKGFRAAWWFGAGLDGIGLLIALYFVWKTRPKRQPSC